MAQHEEGPGGDGSASWPGDGRRYAKAARLSASSVRKATPAGWRPARPGAVYDGLTRPWATASLGSRAHERARHGRPPSRARGTRCLTFTAPYLGFESGRRRRPMAGRRIRVRPSGRRRRRLGQLSHGRLRGGADIDRVAKLADALARAHTPTSGYSDREAAPCGRCGPPPDQIA